MSIRGGYIGALFAWGIAFVAATLGFTGAAVWCFSVGLGSIAISYIAVWIQGKPHDQP